MAQKAAKAIAKRNTAVLNNLHILSLLVNLAYFLLRVLLFRRSFTTSSLLRYVVLSAPAVAIEVLFEWQSRPRWTGANLKRAGEDLEAQGLTTWMWDVVYWTWGCTIGSAVLGDWVWWFYAAVPVYSAYAAYSTYKGLGFSGLGAQAGAAADAATATGSKRQAKMEKRGQKIQYR